MGNTYRIVLLLLFAFVGSSNVAAHGGHGGSAQLQQHNNDRTIAAQVYGGLHEDKGEVKITFYGNIAFEIVSPRGVKIFVDPWRNDITGMFPPWYIRDMPYRQLVINFIDKDPCPPNETLQWDNSMYVIETGGLRILHWGDNRQNPPDYVWDMIGDIDIAILAISDDGHILSQAWADVVMKKSKANIVIPGHYFVKGVNIPEAYGLLSAAEWTSKHEHTLLDSASITLTPDEVKKYDQHVMYFGDHVAFETGGKLPGNPDGKLPPVPEPVRAWERFAPK